MSALTNQHVLTDEETLIELIAEHDAIIAQYKLDKIIMASGSLAEKLALHALMVDKLKRVNYAIYRFTGKA